MKTMKFDYDLRRQLKSGLVEHVGTFSITTYVECYGEIDEDDVIEFDINSLIDAMRDEIEGIQGSNLLGIPVGEIWVTPIVSEFNPFTFDVNGVTYLCVPHTENKEKV